MSYKMGLLSNLTCRSISCGNSDKPIISKKKASIPQSTSENDYDNPSSTPASTPVSTPASTPGSGASTTTTKSTTSTGSGKKNPKDKGGFMGMSKTEMYLVIGVGVVAVGLFILYK